MPAVRMSRESVFAALRGTCTIFRVRHCQHPHGRHLGRMTGRNTRGRAWRGHLARPRGGENTACRSVAGTGGPRSCGVMNCAGGCGRPGATRWRCRRAIGRCPRRGEAKRLDPSAPCRTDLRLSQKRGRGPTARRWSVCGSMSECRTELPRLDAISGAHGPPAKLRRNVVAKRNGHRDDRREAVPDRSTSPRR